MITKITPDLLDRIERERAPHLQRVRLIGNLLEREPHNMGLLHKLEQVRKNLSEINRRNLEEVL